MVNLVTTNVDLGNVIMEGVADHDDILTLAGAGVVPEGTILARDSGTNNLVIFVKGGVANENGIPKAVLTYDIDGVIGNNALRVMKVGKVNFTRLIIAADGDNTNIDSAVRDQLRDYSIEVTNVTNLSILDNQ